MTAILKLFAVLPLIVCSLPALAIYKCEEHGKVVYSDKECVGGSTIAIDGTNARISETALDEANARNKREKETLNHLRTARQKEEAAEEKERQKRLRAAEASRKKCQSMAMKLKWSEEDAVLANGKSIEKARRTASRQREKYQAECGGR